MDISTVTESNQVLFRLAYFDPTSADEYGNQVLDYLVLDAMTTYGIMYTSDPSSIRAQIKKTFKVEFEEIEIIESGKRLHKNQLIHYIEPKERFGIPKFQLLPGTESKINGNLNEVKNLEKKVFSDWQKELENKYKEHLKITSQLDKVVTSFKSFLTKLFVRHGVESVALLYPDDNKTNDWLDNIKDSIINDIPNLDSELNVLLQLEIPIFFRSTDKERNQYVDSLFNASFFWHMLQIDDKCSHLVRQVTSKQTLILDNNILFSLIGFHGERMLESVHSMLNIAKQLGYELLVSTKTIEEFQESLKNQFKELRQKPPLPSTLATIALKVLNNDNYLTTYWKEFVKTGIKIEEFISEKSHIETILQGLGIDKIDKFKVEIEESQNLIDEESILRQACGDLHPAIINHDAFHKLLVEKLREGNQYNFSEVKVWFLTHDSKLPVYAKASNKGKKVLPFCITTNQWIQINRPLLARTTSAEEFEESFHNLVTQPFLRTLLKSFSAHKVQERLFLKFTRYTNMTSEIAFKVATDTHFLSTLSLNDEEVILEKKVESELININHNLQKEHKTLIDNYLKAQDNIEMSEADKKLLQQEIKLKEKELNNYENSVKELNLQKEEKSKIIDNISKELNEEKNRTTKLQEDVMVLQEALKNEVSEREKSQESLSNLIDQISSYKKLITWWGLFLILLVITSTSLWNFENIIDWKWFSNHPNNFPIKMLVQLLLIFALLNIPLKKEWSKWLPIIIALTIAIMAQLKQ